MSIRNVEQGIAAIQQGNLEEGARLIRIGLKSEELQGACTGPQPISGWQKPLKTHNKRWAFTIRRWQPIPIMNMQNNASQCCWLLTCHKHHKLQPIHQHSNRHSLLDCQDNQRSHRRCPVFSHHHHNSNNRHNRSRCRGNNRLRHSLLPKRRRRHLHHSINNRSNRNTTRTPSTVLSVFLTGQTALEPASSSHAMV